MLRRTFACTRGPGFGCAVVLAVVGCAGLGLSFNRGVDIPVLTIDGAAVPEEEEAPPFQTTLVLDVGGDVLGGEPGVVTAVTVVAADLWVHESSESDSGEDGLPDDLSFLNSVEIYLEADVGGVPRRTLVASVAAGGAGLPPGSDYVALGTTGAALLELMSAPGGCVFTADVAGAVPPDDVAVAGQMVFHVAVAAQ
jgi:hypothetical protein